MTSERSAGLVEDAARLHHLDHEGGAPARQVVGGTDAREQPVDDADVRRARRHERAHLRQHGDECVLAQEGRLAGHVRAGDEPDARLRHFVKAGRHRLARGASTQSFSMKAPALAACNACSTTGWRPPRISKAVLSSRMGRM